VMVCVLRDSLYLNVFVWSFWIYLERYSVIWRLFYAEKTMPMPVFWYLVTVLSTDSYVTAGTLWITVPSIYLHDNQYFTVRHHSRAANYVRSKKRWKSNRSTMKKVTKKSDQILGYNNDLSKFYSLLVKEIIV